MNYNEYLTTSSLIDYTKKIHTNVDTSFQQNAYSVYRNVISNIVSKLKTNNNEENNHYIKLIKEKNEDYIKYEKAKNKPNFQLTDYLKEGLENSIDALRELRYNKAKMKDLSKTDPHVIDSVKKRLTEFNDLIEEFIQI